MHAALTEGLLPTPLPAAGQAQGCVLGRSCVRAARLDGEITREAHQAKRKSRETAFLRTSCRALAASLKDVHAMAASATKSKAWSLRRHMPAALVYV